MSDLEYQGVRTEILELLIALTNIEPCYLEDNNRTQSFCCYCDNDVTNHREDCPWIAAGKLRKRLHAAWFNIHE